MRAIKYDMSSKKDILQKYIPGKAVMAVVDLLERYPCHLKIVNKRSSKHGDFKRFSNGNVQITVNNDLNHYRFLVTLVHELAHLVTYKEYRKTKPHGSQWKMNFKKLMIPFLTPDIFPNDVLEPLARYLINPKASSDADINLSLAFRRYDGVSDKSLIFEIPDKSRFQYRNRTFIKGERRRTRFECIEVQTHRKYIFHPHAEVDLIKQKL